MKVIIIDDEKTSIEALEKQLRKYEDVQLVGTATNGMKGIALVRQEMPDLLFLDVELPDISGLEFLDQMKQITTHQCRVVIYTAHSSYMLPAFRGRAFDFLLKPVAEGEVQKIMQRYYWEESENKNKQQNSEKAVTRKENQKVVLYTNATDFRVVDMRDIGLFLYNHDQRIWEVVVAGKALPLRLKRTVNYETLTEIDSRFVQVSQRFIININYLLEVSNNICRFYPPFDGIDNVKVGRQYRKQLLELFSTL